MIKQLFKKMVPASILSSIALNICIQIDIIVIARMVGLSGLSAHGLTNPVFILLSAISNLLATGTTIVSSKLVGRGNAENIKSHFTSVIVMALSVGFLISFFITLKMDFIVSWLGANLGSELFAVSSLYLKGYLIGIPAIFLFAVLTPFLHLSGKRNLVYASIATMTVVDVILDIVGCTVFKTGMFGIGLATAVSEISACLIVIPSFLKRDCMFKISFKTFSFSYVLHTITNGLHVAVNQVCFTFSVYVMNRLLIKYGGSSALAIYSVITSLTTFCFSISSGIGGTTQILAGVFIGEEDTKSVINVLKQGLLLSVIINSFLATTIFVFSPYFASIYVKGDFNTVQMTSKAIRLLIFSLIPMGVSLVFKNYYPCIKKLNFAVLVTVCENLAFIVPMYFIMSYLFNLNGLWFTKVLSETFTVLLIYIISVCSTRNFTPEAENFSLLRKQSGNASFRESDFEIKKQEDISEVSDNVQKFCSKSDCTGSLPLYIALCVEEIAALIIENNGFNHNILIETKVADKGTYWIIRVRDNCKSWDLASFINLHKNEDSISHLGVKMVYKLVSGANYCNAMGFNCLTLRLDKRGLSKAD